MVDQVFREDIDRGAPRQGERRHDDDGGIGIHGHGGDCRHGGRSTGQGFVVGKQVGAETRRRAPPDADRCQAGLGVEEIPLYEEAKLE